MNTSNRITRPNATNGSNTLNRVIGSYRYQLDKTSKKWPCPQCQQKRFVRVLDTESHDYLPDHVGRCDRENGCGYEYTAAQYLADTKSERQPLIKPEAPVQEAPLAYLPQAMAMPTLDSRHHLQNNLFLFLCGVFGKAIAMDLFTRYLVGTSRHWKGAHVYWQIDRKGNVRQCKIMLCDGKTGKRVKEGAQVYRWDKPSAAYVLETTDKACSMVYGRFLDDSTRELNLQQCFFGEHLLAEHPDKPVCIVESEKTALIASVYLPGFVWLATGGASGCRWRDYATYKALAGRSVTFFPDYGYFNRKTERTCFDEWQERCERISDALPASRIRVSDVLERRLADQERKDEDLADLLLTRDEQTGLALTESGYPVMWEYSTNLPSSTDL